jgi:uncharacterized repeat protein (TIGR03803 family)
MQNRNKKCARILSAAVAGLWAVSPVFGGYTLNTLTAFNKTNGSEPAGGVILSGSTLYGTTNGGGANNAGTVYSIPTTGGSPNTLVTFNIANGYEPYGELTLLGSTLYGTTEYGGAGGGLLGNGYGIVYSVPVNGGSPTTLVTFDDANGGNPGAGLTLSGSTFYGTTAYQNVNGTVFSVPVTGGSPTTLVAFNGSNGSEPLSGVTLSGSTLYGTTINGGTYNHGIVYSIPVTGGNPTTLVNFNSSNGAAPVSGLLLSGSTLYGTTEIGGANNSGVVFSVPVTGGPLTILATFNKTNGANPQGGLVLLGDSLYGTTDTGGADNDGIIFSVPITGGSPATLYTFTGTNGAGPYSDLTLSGNTIYGTTKGDDHDNYGTVFSLVHDTSILSLTTTAPTNFGRDLGPLNVSGSHGNYTTGSISVDNSPIGYLDIGGFNPSTDTEVYALAITDSVPANLATDLSSAASLINAASYSGYGVTASTTDPLGIFGNGYDLFLTITDPTLGTGSPYLGFDFTQLTGTTDTLSVNSVAAVPEPASLGLLAIGSLPLLGRRRKCSDIIGK